MFKRKVALILGLASVLAMPATNAFSHPVDADPNWPPQGADPAEFSADNYGGLTENDTDRAALEALVGRPLSQFRWTRKGPGTNGYCIQSYALKICWGFTEMNSPPSDKTRRDANIVFPGRGFCGTPTMTTGLSIDNSADKIADHYVVFSTEHKKTGNRITGYEFIARHIDGISNITDKVTFNFVAFGQTPRPGC